MNNRNEVFQLKKEFMHVRECVCEIVLEMKRNERKKKLCRGGIIATHELEK